MQKGQAKCGATTRQGSACKDIAMANGKCKRHGGKSSGPIEPLRGEKSPVRKHGIYEAYYTDEEKALDIQLGSVDGELELVRIRLRRTLVARAKWEEEIAKGRAERQEDGSLVLVEHVEDESVGPEGSVVPTEKKVFRLPDFDKIEQACLARIESLEKTRKELMKDAGSDSDDPSGARDRVKFTGGLDGGNDDDLPTPFDK